MQLASLRVGAMRRVREQRERLLAAKGVFSVTLSQSRIKSREKDIVSLYGKVDRNSGMHTYK
jgi:hypothetical protein